MGINFHYVENGIFDRKSKTNLLEAEKVIDLIFEHFIYYPNRSLGVVAFSISQQQQIEELIQKRRDENDDFAKFFENTMKEPFFVKNLESVQGDERDTIIFSIGYAKDAIGKFNQNFGPLNKQGGERRLNVAITRAKYNIKLVASIKSYDIDISKTQSIGVKLLKNYLDYAEHGINMLHKNIENDLDAESESDFELEIFEFIKSKDYNVEKQVGCSGYRIDLGLKHPKNNDYVLAIECDGATYHSGKTTRDRDRLRQEILEKMGWKFYRIWSTDWFTNKLLEKERLISAIEKSILEFDSNKKVNDDFIPIKESINKNSINKNEMKFILEEETEKYDLKSLFNEYETYPLNLNREYNNLNEIIYFLIEKEQPITEILLMKKIISLFKNRKKITNSFIKEFKIRIRKNPNIFKIKDYYVIDKNLEIKMRIPKHNEKLRDILMISNDELSSGMKLIIENSITITQDGLFSTIVNLLGFKRIGSKIMEKLLKSIEQLIKANLVVKINDEYAIK